MQACPKCKGALVLLFTSSYCPTCEKLGQERTTFSYQIAPSVAPTSVAASMFDFGDGKGLVPAHKHYNGGGWVADTAIVDNTVFVVSTARVFGYPRVHEDVQIYGTVVGAAIVCGRAKVYGVAGGTCLIQGDTVIDRNAVVLSGTYNSGVIT